MVPPVTTDHRLWTRVPTEFSSKMHLVEIKQRIRRSLAVSFESVENRVNFDNAEELQEIPRNSDAKIRRSKDPPIFKRVYGVRRIREPLFFLRLRGSTLCYGFFEHRYTLLAVVSRGSCNFRPFVDTKVSRNSSRRLIRKFIIAAKKRRC